MQENWRKTQSLFSKLIIAPPFLEQYLKKISKLQIGFPKGHFTSEEGNLNYFSTYINHRKAILTKIIDITKIITKNNFDIDNTNILKGVEEEKTIIFIHNFYLAAITKDNLEIIFKKYSDEKIRKKFKTNIVR